jgi:ubiquinone/menaquinone biosynthesis C-methylase UbiE
VAANGRRSRPSPRGTPDTSWERLAPWYDGWVGSGGSRYHREIAVPLVLELLDPRPGERILDVGTGQGVLAPEIARRGARYTGVDSSPALIDRARRRHGGDGRFLVADARRLDAVPGLRRGSFDAAVFLLSIQDMDPLDVILPSVGRLLRPSARVVVVMTHPAFRQPRHAGWGYDEGRRLVFRRIDAYLTAMAVPMKSVGGSPRTRSFHRPISAYVNGLAAAGFSVDAMREVPDLPDSLRPRNRHAATRADAEIPLFLAVRARRP